MDMYSKIFELQTYPDVLFTSVLLPFIYLKNKDENIHKSKALKWNDKRTLTLVECQDKLTS